MGNFLFGINLLKRRNQIFKEIESLNFIDKNFINKKEKEELKEYYTYWPEEATRWSENKNIKLKTLCEKITKYGLIEKRKFLEKAKIYIENDIYNNKFFEVVDMFFLEDKKVKLEYERIENEFKTIKNVCEDKVVKLFHKFDAEFYPKIEKEFKNYQIERNTNKKEGDPEYINYEEAEIRSYLKQKRNERPDKLKLFNITFQYLKSREKMDYIIEYFNAYLDYLEAEIVHSGEEVNTKLLKKSLRAKKRIDKFKEENYKEYLKKKEKKLNHAHNKYEAYKNQFKSYVFEYDKYYKDFRKEFERICNEKFDCENNKSQDKPFGFGL